jgi:hypothetical protein
MGYCIVSIRWHFTWGFCRVDENWSIVAQTYIVNVTLARFQAITFGLVVAIADPDQKGISINYNGEC